MKKTDLENIMDKELRIQTSGRDDSKEDDYHHPYEPTPYTVLERLAKSEYITKDNILVDYGCGKGRVDFYLSAQIGCQTIGVDFDGRMIKKALENTKVTQIYETNRYSDYYSRLKIYDYNYNNDDYEITLSY